MATQEDDFTREQYLAEARWYCLLSNGLTVFQDDDRPGADPASAWLRLAGYLRENPGLRIRRMWLAFRDNAKELILPENAEGYFFRKSALGIAFADPPITLLFYLVGYLEGDVVHVQRWTVPIMVQVEQEKRVATDPETVGISLIRNQPYVQTETGQPDNGLAKPTA